MPFNIILFGLIVLIFNSSLPAQNDIKPKPDFKKTHLKARQALRFCKEKKFNTNFCILIDMSLHSGVKRFFVWDFKKDTIVYSCLVSHGSCKNPWKADKSKASPQFSNENDSHCSSLGRYKIGERGYSDFGVHVKYLLYGLDSTNSNAFKRYIVFHSWDAVPDEEIYPKGTPEGWGCPTISNNSFLKVDKMLQKTSAPVLMWIYN